MEKVAGSPAHRGDMHVPIELFSAGWQIWISATQTRLIEQSASSF